MQADVVEHASIRNFRGIEALEFELDRSQLLPGHWTCIAGINGSGKTSVLQAIALALMGPFGAIELGSRRLGRMCRRDANGKQHSAHIEVGDCKLDIRPTGRPDGFRPEGYDSMLLVSYGATRNLTDRGERSSDLGEHVERHITLFDPLTRLATAESVLSGGHGDRALARTMERLTRELLHDSDIDISGDEKEIAIRSAGTAVQAVELPDGFRSTLAWLTDLAARWHRYNPRSKGGDLGAIRGVVLIDEIDLHLHPELQRTLVTRLRHLLPKVQFIVTTHSPLVLASFDKDELILLDASMPGGIRQLDRQIMGFRSDEVMTFLMGASPHSAALTTLPEDQQALYGYLSPVRDTPPKEAQAKLEWRRSMVKKLRAQKS